ncbi:MAG: hypothetical protein P8Y12_05800 [Gammaproteobacteria bacterium]
MQSTEEEIETVSEDSQIESVVEQEKVELSDEPQPTLSQEADADEQDLTAENNKQPVSKNQS